jgi:hypothetical protein
VVNVRDDRKIAEERCVHRMRDRCGLISYSNRGGLRASGSRLACEYG